MNRFPIYSLLFGIAAIAGGILVNNRTSDLLKNGKIVTATVVTNSESLDDDGDKTTYCAIVDYTTDKDKVIRREVGHCDNQPIPEGMKIEVIYDPSNPNHVEVYPPTESKIVSIGFIVFGIICVGLAAFVAFRKKP